MGMHSTYTATHYKDLNIDWQARAVTRHGEDILLTPQEFALLQVLFDHRGQAVSRGDPAAYRLGLPLHRHYPHGGCTYPAFAPQTGAETGDPDHLPCGVYPFLNIIGNTNQYFFRLCPSKSGLSPLPCGIMRVFGCI